jgi:hypothetical protein
VAYMAHNGGFDAGQVLEKLMASQRQPAYASIAPYSLKKQQSTQRTTENFTKRISLCSLCPLWLKFHSSDSLT